MTIDPHRLEVDAVDFQIACRRFTVRATITRDRQLPVVDEFVLRLLAILDRMPVARMRAWFGFSESEMQTVLVDIGRRNLIEFEGEEVALAPAGRDLFKTVGARGVPQIVEVAPLIGDVWFDLVSRSMVPRSRSKPADYLVKMAELPTARELPEAFARAAFEDNFRDYVRRIRRFPNPDAINLYSISGVEGGSYGYQVLQAVLALDTDQMSVRPTFPEMGDGVMSFQKLAVAANEAWKTVSAPDLTPSTATEFERMTGETRLSSLIGDPVSVAAWVNALSLPELPNSNFRPTIGATYLNRNLKWLLEAVRSSSAESPIKEVIWARPNGSTWGRTVRVGETLSELRNALRDGGHQDVGTILVMPRSTHKFVRYGHKRLFDRGQLLPQGHLPANLEVLLVPGVVALVSVHVPVGRHAVPIGGLVTDARRLARLGERLRFGQVEGWGELWIPSPSKKSAERS
jgi:hypothetical protein